MQLYLYIYVDDDRYLKKTLDSIVSSQNEEAQIEIVLLDSLDSKSVKKAACAWEKQKNGRVSYVSCKGKSMAQAYNENLCTTDEGYVNFMKAAQTFDKGALCEVTDRLKKEKTDIISLVPVYYGRKDYKRDYLRFEQPRGEMIDLREKMVYYNPFLGSYFFHASLLKDMRFNEQSVYEQRQEMLIRLLDKAGKYYLLTKEVTVYEDLEVDPYNYPDLYEKSWYTDHVRDYMIPVLKNGASRFVQFAMLYHIGTKFAGNMNDRNKTILTKEEKEEFYQEVTEALQYMDDDVILYNQDMEMKRMMSRHMYYSFIAAKYKGNPPVVTFKKTKQGMAAVMKGAVVEEERFLNISIGAINNQKEYLEIWGKLKNGYFLKPEQIKIYAKVSGEQIPAKRNQIYSLVKFFGETVKKDYSFKICIDKKKLQGNKRISIWLQYGEHKLKLQLMFIKPQSRLYEEFPQSYWRFDNQYLRYDRKNRELICQKANFPLGIIREVKFWGSALKYGEEMQRSVKSIMLRMVYFLTRPYYKKKNIWITYDQLFKGGDNGEYFYRYVSERKEKGNIEIYYIANKDSREYKELNPRYGTVLAFNSFKHKLVCLHGDYIFATRVAFNVYCGYWKETEKYFRGLFNADVFCLQHGLTIQKIAQYQNRLFDNTKLYFCVSPVEMDNLRKPVYGYEEKELVLTGAPRYDGLVSKDKHYILISPTWRRNVTAGTNKKGKNHEYSLNFKHTEYFRIYNRLINDKRLIECAKKNGYKLIYLIHPILSPQVKDFDKNDYVEIIPGAGNVSYEKMLSEASMMLTDHSGIQFDFAYMKKPLVYYHPESLPPQYEEGGLKYETMGFGPVCKTHEQTVDALCAYMEKNCVIDEKYKERIENFFGYEDHNNCERIYQAAIAYMKKQGRFVN